MRARRFVARSRLGRTALLAVVSMLLSSACTVSTAGHASRGTIDATTGEGAMAGSATTTVTTVRKIAAAPQFTYQVGAPVRRSQIGDLAWLPWWGAAINTNYTSSLTTDGSHDDSATQYISPTSPVQPKNAASPGNSSAGDLWSGVGLTGRTNGQLIGIAGDQAYTCSGTVVHSAAKNMVLTAGHCVWNIPVGKPANQGAPAMTLLDKIWFVPGASELSVPVILDPHGQPIIHAPYGIWKVNGAYTNNRWLQNTWVTESGSGLKQTELMHGAGSYDDIAFLTVETVDGQEIESVTGAQGLMFSDTANTALGIIYPTIILGYPSTVPFDGSAQRYCTQRLPTSYQGDALVQTAEVSCALTPGSSGGAWFSGFDGVDGVGYVYGVTSRGGESQLTVGMLSLAQDYPLYRKVAG